jgi:hypothetical protein
MINLNIDKLQKFYDEENLFMKMNPELSKLIYDIIENKVQKNNDDKVNISNKQTLPIIDVKEVEKSSNFINSINKMDTFINSITYDEIIKKPDFFYDFESDTIQNYINGTSKILYFSKSSTKNEEFDLDKLRDTKLSTNKFAQKKLFMDISTEFISRNAVYTDSRQELIFKFQYLVNTLFNKSITQYKEKNSLGSEDILFIYKGGTFMKIMFEKYNSLFKHNLEFMDKNIDFFKRSDSDYAMAIDKFDIRQYTLHYYNLNIITYNLLKKIQKYINENLNDVLPIDELTDSQFDVLLSQYNTQLTNSRDALNESGKNYFVNVEKFIGLSLYNKTYMKENIPEKFNYYKLKSIDDTRVDLSDIDDLTINPLGREYQFKNNKKVSTKRDNFYITFTKSSDKLFSAIENIPSEPTDSGIYQYYNETNYFKAIKQNNINYFTLHRAKINIILYFKTYDNAYGYFLCPSELIDIPVRTFYDYKKNIDFTIAYKAVVNEIKNKKLMFNCYTLYGLIHDLYNALFQDSVYPWEDKKYSKKIHRYSFFLTLYLNNKYKNFTEIQKNILDFLSNPDTPELTKFIGSDDKVYSTDTLYHELFTAIRELIKVIVSPEEKKEFNDIMKIMKNNIEIFNYEPNNPEFDSKVESVPYLKKYLKYKQKYISLKNKTN